MHIIEKWLQLQGYFTMTNIKCKEGREIDILAIHPKENRKVHVESRVSTTCKIRVEDTQTKKGRPHKRGLDFFSEKKFNHPSVREKIHELFGDSDYEKWLVLWSWEDKKEDFLEKAHQYGIAIFDMPTILATLVNEHLKGAKGSRDDILRTIELIAQMRIGIEDKKGKSRVTQYEIKF